jgi:phosphonate transport system permease protein
MLKEAAAPAPLPPRTSLPGLPQFALSFFGIAFFVWSAGMVGISLEDFIDGIPHMARLVGEMTPPDFSRGGFIFRAILLTFQMAFVGAAIGIVLSFFLSLFAASNLSPHPALYSTSRWLIALFRTVPDLVWAVFFVATVGLGAFAGTLTIIVDTMGFCGRFFAEAMEEADRGPQEALAALGAGKLGTAFASVVPAAIPSFTNTSLFSLEKAVRSSVVLGLVGAGGIGIELKVAMDMFMYAEAAAIILCVFVLVLAVEKTSTFIRRKLL